MAKSNSRNPKQTLVVGEKVEVTWLDSGAGAQGEPAKWHARLVFKTTLGRVTFLGSDTDVHKRICASGKCRCNFVELTMCSAGNDDPGSDLGAIWTEAIISVKVLK